MDTLGKTKTVALLEANDIVKTFPGVRALDGVRLTVRHGTVNALLGENGAGKSTLMKILAGVFPPDSGTLTLDGQIVSFRNPREAQQAGISIIFQELNLAPNLTVAENIFLGREPTTKLGLVNYRQMNQQAAELLRRLGLAIDPERRADQLTVASQQVVEIARALAIESKVLILDEPTSALTEQEVAALFRVIHQLKAEGVGLIYITHRLEELPHIADDVTVFRDGTFVAAKPFPETTPDELVRLMVGRDAHLGGMPVQPVDTGATLEVEELTVAATTRNGRPLVENVSFRVALGEVLSVFGLMGAGRTELLQAMFGLYPRRTTGRIFVNGKQERIRSPEDAIAAGIALAPEDRKNEGLVLGMSVSENISLTCFDRVSVAGFVQPARERQLCQGYVDRMAIKTPGLRQAVVNLSGGNQQKVVLAKWLATNPKVLLLDEPTRGIDIGAKQEIYALIRKLARQGLAVVLVSSELPEVLALSNRIIVLSEGRITGEFARDMATEDVLLTAALPASTTSHVA